MNHNQSDHSLHRCQLERQIDALVASVKRARSILYAGMVVVFVVAVAMFNATLGWNSTQIDRRARLIQAAYSNYSTLDSLIQKTDFLKSAFSDSTGELAYLRYVKPQNEYDSLRWNCFRDNASHDLQSHVLRGVAFDTITLPFIGVSIAATDIGVLGGLAAAIIGFWLFAAIRRENHAMQEFVKRDPKTGAFTTKLSVYSDQELAYAFQSIVHYMVFIQARKPQVLGYTTVAVFSLPPVLFLVNHVLSWIQVFSKGLQDYSAITLVLELMILVLISIIWLRAMWYQWDTMRALRAWADHFDFCLPPPDTPQ
jgi:hypothetical protein